MDVPHIGILGVGLMGHGLAQVFATRKCNVMLYAHDREALSKSISRIRSNLEIFISMGILDTDDVEKSMKTCSLTWIVLPGHLHC